LRIFVLTSFSTSMESSLDAAFLLGADVMIVEKAGGITTAYPISEKGKTDLDTLVLRSHFQSQYNTSFYPIPMVLKEAKAYLERRFEVEYVSS